MNKTEKNLIWLEQFVQKGGIVQNNVNWSQLVGTKVNQIKSIGNPNQLIRLNQFLTRMEERINEKNQTTNPNRKTHR